MARAFDATLKAALQSEHARPIILFKISTLGGDVNVWTGYGPITFNSEIYLGTGELGKVGEILEAQDLSAQGMTLELAGINSDKISLAATQIEHNRVAICWLGALNLSTGALEGVPYEIGRFITDVVSMQDNGKTSTIKINLENRMIDLERTRVRRYTHHDQQIDHPGDDGFNQVGLLQDRQFVWGR